MMVKKKDKMYLIIGIIIVALLIINPSSSRDAFFSGFQGSDDANSSVVGVPEIIDVEEDYEWDYGSCQEQRDLLGYTYLNVTYFDSSDCSDYANLYCVSMSKELDRIAFAPNNCCIWDCV